MPNPEIFDAYFWIERSDILYNVSGVVVTFKGTQYIAWCDEILIQDPILKSYYEPYGLGNSPEAAIKNLRELCNSAKWTKWAV